MIALQILKVIGIVLAVIIGLIIVIICLVLFAPFSYKITAEGANEDINTMLSVKWLGGLLHLGGVLNGTDIGAFELKMHFAGLEIKKKENSLASRIIKRIGLGLWNVLKKSFFGIEPDRKAEKAADEEPEDEDAPAFILKLRKLKKKMKKLWGRVKDIWEKLKLAKYVLGAPVTARAWKNLKIYLAGLLNHIKPKSMEGEITFGTGDPARTAEIYGLTGWIAPLLDERLEVNPDMDDKNIQLDVVIKGRIFVRFVLSSLWKILTDREIRRVAGYIGRNL